MPENQQVKMSVFQKIRQIPSNISREKKQKTRNQSKEAIREKILTPNSSFQVREAYKVLRTNLIFSLPMEGCKKIIVTSSLASEGKSTNCINLAITFAEMNAKVLLIDADLRRPNLARMFNVPASPGLSNYLVGLNSIDEVIRESEYKNLDYIVSGNIPPNPAEILSSDNMGKMLEELSKRYDYIFMDTAPVNLVTDTAVISKYVHGIVMIALHNSTDQEALKYALNQLNFVGAKVLGFVLNGVVYGNNGSYKYNSKKKYYRYGRKKRWSRAYYDKYSKYSGYGYGYGKYKGYSYGKTEPYTSDNGKNN